ncbi:MAG: hypothetical protein ACREM8_07600 [Vulcanimicrobiaceae bacterium]
MQTEKPATELSHPEVYRPNLELRDRGVLRREMRASIGGLDSGGLDAVAANLSTLIGLSRMTIELLLDVRDLLGSVATSLDPSLTVRWERRHGYRKGEQHRGLD